MSKTGWLMDGWIRHASYYQANPMPQQSALMGEKTFVRCLNDSTLFIHIDIVLVTPCSVPFMPCRWYLVGVGSKPFERCRVVHNCRLLNVHDPLVSSIANAFTHLSHS